MCNQSIIFFISLSSIQSLLSHHQLLPEVLYVLVSLLFVHIADVNIHRFSSLGIVYLHMLQFQVVIPDLVHQVGTSRKQAYPSSWWSQKRGRRRWWRWRKIHHCISSDVILVVGVLFTYLFLSHLNFLLKVFIVLLLSLTLCLIEDCFFNDDAHHVFVGKVFFGEFESIKNLLPLGRNILAVKCAIC